MLIYYSNIVDIFLKLTLKNCTKNIDAVFISLFINRVEVFSFKSVI